MHTEAEALPDEDITLEDDRDVDTLAHQLEVDAFNLRLREAAEQCSALEAAQSRPSRYNKFNSTKRTTIRARDKKITKETTQLRQSGFPDVSRFFDKAEPTGITDSNMANTIEDGDIAEIPVLPPNIYSSPTAIASSHSPTSIEGRQVPAEITCHPPMPLLYYPGYFSYPSAHTYPYNYPPTTIPIPLTSTIPTSLSTTLDSVPVYVPPSPTSADITNAINSLQVIHSNTSLHPIVEGRILNMLAFLRIYSSPQFNYNWTKSLSSPQ